MFGLINVSLTFLLRAELDSPGEHLPQGVVSTDPKKGYGEWMQGYAKE